MSTATAANVYPIFGTDSHEKAKKPYVRLTDEQRGRLDAELRAMENPGTVDYRQLAVKYEVSLRAVERRVAATRNADAPRSVTTGRTCDPLPDDTLIHLAATGQRHMVWEHFVAEGIYHRGYPNFTRQLNSQFGANVVTGACKGTAGMDRKLSQVLQKRPPMNIFTLDFFSLRAPFMVGREVITPMAMFVREACSDMIVNEVVFETANITAEMVAAVVGQAFRGRIYPHDAEDGSSRDVFVGGLPDFVYCDNESKLHAKALNAAYAGLGVNVIATNSYSSNENGAHERLHGTIRTQVLDLVPNSSRGPRDRRGELMNEGEIHDISLAHDLVRAFAYKHNTEAATNGSPLDRWVQALDDGVIVRRAQPYELAPLALQHPTSCQRYKQGVLLLNEKYTCPELTNYPGKRFMVSRWPGDDNHVELFTADATRTYVGTAVRNGAHTAAEANAMMQHNAEEERIVEMALAAAGPVRAAYLQRIRAQAPRTESVQLIADVIEEPTAQEAANSPRLEDQVPGPRPSDDSPFSDLTMPNTTTTEQEA